MALLCSACPAQGVSSDTPAGQSSKRASVQADETGEKTIVKTEDSKPIPRPETGLNVNQPLPKLSGFFSTEPKIICLTCPSSAIAQLIVLGQEDDDPFYELLQDVDAVVQKYDSNKIVAFGVFAKQSTTGLISEPTIDEWPLRLKNIQQRLRIKIPLSVAIRRADGKDTLAENFGVRRSPVVLFVDSSRVVRYAAISPPDLSRLDQTVQNVLPKP